MTYTICVLLYGDRLDLAERCLTGIIDTARYHQSVLDVRVGANALGAASLRYLRELEGVIPVLVNAPLVTYRPAGNANALKYPMMREMFYGPVPLAADNVMWFDDDSFIRDGRHPAFWRAVNGLMADADMIGSPYAIRQRGLQYEWVRRQPWYRGKPVDANSRFHFMTGGWWCCKAARLKEIDYPFRDIVHNGGDSMLGEAARQQGWKTARYNEDVAINYDESRGGESKAARRGETSAWPGQYAGPPPPAVPIDAKVFQP